MYEYMNKIRKNRKREVVVCSSEYEGMEGVVAISLESVIHTTFKMLTFLFELCSSICLSDLV